MSDILDLDATAAHVSGLVHLETQRAEVGLDLTVGAVFRVTGPGSLDFGGSEEESADREEVTPRVRQEDDDYGWWELRAGRYVIRYNESLALEAGQLAHVLPLERLFQAGSYHPTFVVDGSRDPLEALLVVGEAGCDLKENCRVSRLVVTQVADD